MKENSSVLKGSAIYERTCIRSIIVNIFRYHTAKPSPDERGNIFNYDFKTISINHKWCTDITYIHALKDWWTYLASVLDFYSHKIISYAYCTPLTSELL